MTINNQHTDETRRGSGRRLPFGLNMDFAADGDEVASVPSLRIEGRLASLLGLAAVFVIYVTFFRISNIFMTTDLRTTPWNPEAGIAILAGVLFGWRAVPVILLAGLTTQLLWNPFLSPVWVLGSIFGNTVLLTGAAALFHPALERLQRPGVGVVIRFLIFTVAACALSALFKLLVARWEFGFTFRALYPSVTVLAVGNLVGMLTVYPAVMAIWGRRTLLDGLKSVDWLDAVFVAAAVAIAVPVFGLRSADHFKFFYLIFLPVLAIAQRRGFAAATLAALFTNFVMISILYLRGYKPSTVTELQMLMCALSVTALLLGAGETERRRMARALQDSHNRLQDSQAALLQASRLSLASEMAAALAHELNQPLSAARNFIRSVRRRLERKSETERVPGDIDAAVSQIDLAAGTLRNIREFLQRGDQTQRPVDFAALVRATMELVEPEMTKAKVQVAVDLGPRQGSDLAQVMGERQQLMQVLLNLLRNAREAIVQSGRSDGRIGIRVSAATRPGKLEVSVTDNGGGVSSELRDKLFMPLHSTKPDGLGLGLSLSNSIIVSHGGSMWHDGSAVGVTRFCFTIPLASYAAELGGVHEPTHSDRG
ncbi:MAG: MASE1 domain-containing protein [Proteobacteria bacterium]|nr:MASE1 domain-containing protein [Pseudomonadota bacterium]